MRAMFGVCELTNVFPFFGTLHRLLASRPNITPPSVTTGASPFGRQILHLQPIAKPTTTQNTTTDIPIDPGLIEVGLVMEAERQKTVAMAAAADATKAARTSPHHTSVQDQAAADSSTLPISYLTGAGSHITTNSAGRTACQASTPSNARTPPSTNTSASFMLPGGQVNLAGLKANIKHVNNNTRGTKRNFEEGLKDVFENNTRMQARHEKLRVMTESHGMEMERRALERQEVAQKLELYHAHIYSTPSCDVVSIPSSPEAILPIPLALISRIPH